MKCMCPNCGRIINKGEFAFDFTEFVRKNLEDIMKDYEDTTSDIMDGRDILLNGWKNEKKLLTLSEAKLLEYPLSKEESGNQSTKVIQFHMPIQEIKEKMKESKDVFKDDKAVNTFIDWFYEHQEDLKQKTKKLSLVLEGKGDIDFNKVRDVADVRKCPRCFATMSYWAGRYPEIKLTVLGGPRISKSTNVTACIAAFMHGRDRFVEIKGTTRDEEYKVFKNNYLDPYENGKDLKATNTNDNIPRVSFEVSVGEGKICLTFVDLPGELNNENGIDSELNPRYENVFNNIDFVWYCTDPGEIEQLIGEHDLGRQKVIPTETIIDNMSILAAYFKHSKRKVPVAYIVGKTDSIALKESDKKKYGLYDPKRQEVTVPFNVRDFFRRSKNVRAYIMEKNRGLCEAFEENFSERCYIATSAYGYDPKTVGENEERKPQGYNCKEVFYWMLALRNCIKVHVEVTKRKTNIGINETLAKLNNDEREKAYHNLYMLGEYIS